MIESDRCFLTSEFRLWYCTPKLTESDYYQFNDLLTLEEQAIRKKVRECMEKEVAPIMAKVLSCFTFEFFKSSAEYHSMVVIIFVLFIYSMWIFC